MSDQQDSERTESASTKLQMLYDQQRAQTDRIESLAARVDTACKAGDAGMEALGKRADANDADHKHIYARINSLPDQADHDGLSDRITALEARITNEVSQLRRDISVENDHRRSLIERVEGYARISEMADKQLDDNLDKTVAWVHDQIDSMRDWSQEHTTSDDERHATLSKQLTGAKIMLAAGGIAIAYLMGRSTR